MKQLLIATNNKGKVKEFQDLLKGLAVQILTPADIHLILEVEEDGATYAENAAKKARAFARASGLVSLADDSGLEVDASTARPDCIPHAITPSPAQAIQTAALT